MLRTHSCCSKLTFAFLHSFLKGNNTSTITDSIFMLRQGNPDHAKVQCLAYFKNLMWSLHPHHVFVLRVNLVTKIQHTHSLSR